MPGEHKLSGRPCLILSLGLVALLLAAGQTPAQQAEEPPEAEAPQAEAPQVEPPPTLYLYCEECGLEMTCPPGAEEKRTYCPHCIHNKVVMGVFDYSHKDRGGSPSTSRPWEALWFKLLVGGAALLVICERILTRQQRKQQARKKPPNPAMEGKGEVRQWMEETGRIRQRRRRR